MSTTKFFYIRDPGNKDRVLSIALRSTGRSVAEVEYGISVNHPTAYVQLQNTDDYHDQSKEFKTYQLVHGDKFNRKIGRARAVERMENKARHRSGVVQVNPGQTEIDAVLGHLALYSEHRIVREIAEFELEWRAEAAALQETVKSLNSQLEDVITPSQE